MNSERLLNSNSDAVPFFRQIFKNAICQLNQQGENLNTISDEEFLDCARQRKERLTWEIERSNITSDDLKHFDEVMLDYLKDLIKCIQGGQESEALSRCFHELFY